jgi:HK97 family phage major capsid protein
MEALDIRTLVEQQNKAWEELKGEMTLARGASDEKQIKLNDRLDQIEARLSKPPAPAGPGEPNEKTKAVLSYLRTGDKAHLKVLHTESDPSTGYLVVPPEMEATMLKNVVENSPLRLVARVRTTSARSVKVPKRTGVFSATWTAEGGTKTEATGLTYGMEEVPNHELSALVDVSNQDLEDSAVNLEGELRSEFAEQFGVSEGNAFIVGNAVGKPEGIVTNTSVTVQNSGTNADFDGDDLVDLLFALKTPYINNATWLFERLTLRKIRKIKANSEYIWAPAVAGSGANQILTGVPATILERPYLLCTDVAATGTTNNKSVIVGDFKKAYLIVDRIGMEILRDPFTQGASGNVRFIARKRVGGQVVLAEAIKIMKEAT